MGPSFNNADVLSHKIERWVGTSPGMAVIQAGHFMFGPRSGTDFVPLVHGVADAHGAGRRDSATEHPGSQVLDAYGYFPVSSFRLGAGVAKMLHARGQATGLVILANDWQHFRHLGPSDASHARRDLRSTHAELFSPYAEVLDRTGLGVEVIRRLQPSVTWISEYFLRRSIERRLKKLAAKPGETRLEWVASTGRGRNLVWQNENLLATLLVCGQADCAGEIMELIARGRGDGWGVLVNIVPRECETPVLEGTTRAINLFRLRGFRVLTVTTPWGRPPEGDAWADVRVFETYGRDDDQDDDEVLAEQRTLDWNTGSRP